MEPIEDQIVGLQTRNVDGASFVPAGELEQLLTEDVVRATIRQSTIDASKREETIGIVVTGARKIFAILVLQNRQSLILKFIEQDQFQKGPLDGKLPISESILHKVLGKAAGTVFWNNQWMFIAPVFRHDLSHRKLEDAVILPFIKTSHIGDGAFGVVSEVDLHSLHQGLEEPRKGGSVSLVPCNHRASVPDHFKAVKIVRKRIEIDSIASVSHENEGDILSTLRLIQHPNIVRLVTTFQHRNTYNLLFEQADFSLKDLLSKDTRPPLWQSDVAFLHALQGLSSALAVLHDFRVSDLHLHHIGCHHDLKPANVLVKHGSFLLADFGLSRLKSVEENSKTLFRGMNLHNAPECLDSDAGFESSQVGRKSDIWAMGTIVLDVVVYLTRRAQGVKAFEQGRKHKIGAITFYTFHYGGQHHPFVHSCINELDAEAPPSWRPVFRLIRLSLDIEPSSRPTASSLQGSLSLAALKVHTLSVLSRLETFASGANSYDAIVESKTANIWATLLGLTSTGEDWSNVLNVAGHEVDFGRLSQCLSEIDLTLSGLESLGTPPSMIAIRQLSRQIDVLVSELSVEVRSKLNNQLELELLQEIDPKTWMELRHDPNLSADTSNLVMLAIAKIVADHEKPSTMALHVPREFQSNELELRQAIGSQSTRAILAEEPETSVLVEWMPYDRKWRGDVGTELFGRVRALASVLYAHPKPKGFSNLHCFGFYHATQRLSFGLVFEIPQRVSALKTLKQLLTEVPAQDVTLRPSLGNIFTLAHSLANSVLQFHKAKWLHKNISALNICFGCPAAPSGTVDITQHYLIGFNHSRPDSPDAFTHGPNQDPEQKDYSHPEYLRDEVRFRYIFDYYSLGLVLLELGLWRPLTSLTMAMKDEKDQSPEALRSFLLKRYVPRLSVAMGSVYQGVVTRCLTSRFGEADGGDLSILTTFIECVVTPLSTCRA